MASPLCGIVPLVVLIVLVALWIHRRRHATTENPLSRADQAWTLVPALLLAIFAIAGFTGLLESPLASTLCPLVVGACGVVMLQRARAEAWFAEKPAAARVLRDIVLLAIAIACAVLALELPWNTELVHIDTQMLTFEATVVGLILIALYFLGRRHGALVAIGIGACLFIGLAEYFVLLFRGTVFLPRDLFALETAASVAGGYSYTLYESAMAAITAACMGTTFCSLMQPAHPERLGNIGSWAVTLVAGVVFAYAGVNTLVTTQYMDELGVKLDYWYITQGFQRQGFIPEFMAAVQDLKIKKPDGYDAQTAQAALERHEAEYDDRHERENTAASKQFDKLKPTVIAVMNESFTDLSVLGDLGCDYKGPAFFTSPDNGAIAQGKVAVSAFGGGTANAEFEFLSGCTLASVGSGKYPFQTYHLDNIDSLARQFANMGYRTCGMHPNNPGNWKRKTAYPELGFDTSLFIEDFEGSETYHNGVSDAATYDKILELLASSDEPQFIFDVTMQNHSGYKTGNIPSEQMRPVAIDGYDNEFNYQVAEYLACIDESDRALKDFIGKLKKLDRPIVLMFFGDHHPLFSREVNDTVFSDEGDTADHLQRIQQTVYGVWTNYDIAESGVDKNEDISSSTLGAYALELVGAPLTQRQKALLDLRRNVAQIDVFGYKDAKDTWRWPGEDNPSDAAWREILAIDYLTCASRLH